MPGDMLKKIRYECACKDGTTYREWTDYVMHLRAEHLDTPKHACDICGKRLLLYPLLAKHMYDYHMTKWYGCSCGTLCKTEDCFNDHIERAECSPSGWVKIRRRR